MGYQEQSEMPAAPTLNGTFIFFSRNGPTGARTHAGVKLCIVLEELILLKESFIPSVQVIQARQPRDSGQAYGVIDLPITSSWLE